MPENSNYKYLISTEVGVNPEEWEAVRLGDVCCQRNEIIQPSGKGDNKFVGLEHISPGEIGIHAYQLDTNVKSSKFRFYRGDILYGKLRPYLDKAAIADFDGICSTDLLVLTSKNNKAISEFLIYLIHSSQFIQNSISATSGTNHPRTSWKEISKFKFGLPPLPEQRRIAEVLGTVDSAIQKVGGAIEKTERLKKGLMQRLLTKGIGHERFKFSKELDCEIPEEWKYGKIVEFSMTDDNPVQTGPFGAQLHSFDYVDKGVPLILIKNVLDGKIIDKDIPRITETKAKELARYRLKTGDIVFSRVGSVGRTAIVKNYQTGWLISGQMLRIRLENPEIDNDFLSYVILTDWFLKALASKTVGATRKSINTDILSNLPLLVPPLPEQRRIAEILSAADRKLELERRRKEKLERVKKGLMNELLTGRKRVKAEE